MSQNTREASGKPDGKVFERDRRGSRWRRPGWHGLVPGEGQPQEITPSYSSAVPLVASPRDHHCGPPPGSYLKQQSAKGIILHPSPRTLGHPDSLLASLVLPLSPLSSRSTHGTARPLAPCPTPHSPDGLQTQPTYGQNWSTTAA